MKLIKRGLQIYSGGYAEGRPSLMKNVPMDNHVEPHLFPAGMGPGQKPLGWSGVEVNEEVKLSMDTIRSQLETALLDHNRQFERADFSLVSVSENGTFIYRRICLDTGEDVTYQARYDTKQGGVILEFAAQQLINRATDAYNAPYPMFEPDDDQSPLGWSREYAEEPNKQEPLYPNLDREYSPDDTQDPLGWARPIAPDFNNENLMIIT